MKQNGLTVWIMLLTAFTQFVSLTARGAERDTWAKKSEMPTARMGLCTCAVNGKLYAIGGVNHPGVDTAVLRTVEAYDPVTDVWTTKASMSTARNWAACAVVTHRIYVIGGDPTHLSSPRKTVEEYDPASDKWTRKADMPTARSAFAVGVVDGKIYAIGGLTTFGVAPLNIVEAYNPVTDTWERKAPVLTPRGMPAAAVVNGKIFVIGSLAGSGPALPAVEMYDPQTDTWTRRTPMTTARGGLACSTAQGRIYAIGGSNRSTLFSIVEEYDPIGDTWTTRSDMAFADPQSSAKRWALAATEVNGRVYAIGGNRFIQTPSTTLPVVLEYTPPAQPPR